MTNDTRTLLVKVESMTDMGCRPSIALTRELIAEILRMDAVIADQERRIAELRLQLRYHERTEQHGIE